MNTANDIVDIDDIRFFEGVIATLNWSVLPEKLLYFIFESTVYRNMVAFRLKIQQITKAELKDETMNEIQVFENPEFGQVRTLEDSEKILFCGNDVASALGYNNQRAVLSTHCRYVVKRDVPHPQSPDKMIEMSFIPESDVYRLVMRSKLPAAERFSDWVVEEVLPSIRKHGAYMTPETLEQAVLNPDFLILLASRLKAEQMARNQAELNQAHMAIEIAHMEPKVAYFDACVEKNLLLSLRDTAKLYGVEERQLITFLLEHRYLYRGRSGKLLPYATLPAGQLFEVKEVHDPNGRWFGVQTFVTPRGRETFRLLMRGETESRLWGRTSEPPEMTDEDANRAEEYCEKQARKNARKKRR